MTGDVLPDPLLNVEGMARRERRGRYRVAPVDITLRRGEILGILGANGAGKTTLLRLLSGTLAASEGRIQVAGLDLYDAPEPARAQIGYLPESPPLYTEQTVRESLHFAGQLHRLTGRDRDRRVRRMLVACGLDGWANGLIAQLSLGYRKRVGIAQALLHEPALVILDEPTASLDPIQARAIRRLIQRMGRDRATVLATHILTEIEQVCHRVHMLYRGRTVFTGSLATLQTDDAHRLIIGLKGLTDPSPLTRLPGVRHVEALGGQRYRLVTDGRDATRDGLLETAWRSGWQPFELAAERPSLERLFLSRALGGTADASATL